MSSGALLPSDRFVWMCRMPATVTSPIVESWTRRGGSVKPTKTATAATRTAVARKIRLDTGRGTQRGRLVGAFPGELGLGASEVTERRRLLVNRTAQIELLHDSA